MAKSPAADHGLDKGAPGLPTPQLKNAYLSSWQSIEPHGDCRFQLLDHCFVLAAKPRWTDVQVIGRIIDDPDDERQEYSVLLSDYARLVFQNQPTRRFLQGIGVSLVSNKAEIWVFDRAGPSRLRSFQIGKDAEEVPPVIAGFMKMSRHGLGMDTFIQNDGEGSKYVSLSQCENDLGDRVYLQDDLLFSRPDLVANGAVACYRGRAASSRQWDLVVKFVWRLETDRSEERLLARIAKKKVQGAVRLRGLEDIDNVAKFREALGDRTSKRTDFVNRFLSCVIISPYGRPLWHYETTIELLTALRDAAEAHRALYQDAKILHQDVSPENIVITEATDSERSKGVLIDFDLSMDLDAGPRVEGELIGTRPFMAIGVLRRELHTYRHDLESFLYMFLWIAICNPKRSPAKTSKLQDWFKGSWEELVEKKTAHMGDSQFKEIISELSPRFQGLKQLAVQLRQALFQPSEGELFTGTDTSCASTNGLYEDILAAFDAAIQRAAENPENVEATIKNDDARM